MLLHLLLAGPRPRGITGHRRLRLCIRLIPGGTLTGLLEPATQHDEDDNEFAPRPGFLIGGRLAELLKEFFQILLDFHVVLVNHFAEFRVGRAGAEVYLDEHDYGVSHAHEIEDGQAADIAHVHGEERLKDTIDGGETRREGSNMRRCQGLVQTRYGVPKDLGVEALYALVGFLHV